MFRKTATALGVAGCLALAACGADTPTGTATTPGGSSSTSAPASSSSSALAVTSSRLCETYCGELYGWPSSCPPGSTSMTVCSLPMARAADILHDVQKQLLAADPHFDRTAPDLGKGVNQALEFWEDWSTTPVGQHDCSTVFDINSPLFNAPTVGRCTSAAASMGTFLPYVAAQLQAVGGA